jgi:putative intracellular protease/amidase
MREHTFIPLILALTAATAGADSLAWMRKISYCRKLKFQNAHVTYVANYTLDPDISTEDAVASPPLTSFGYILYQGFDTLDVMGPLEAFQTLGRQAAVDMIFIGETMDAVSPKPVSMTLPGDVWQSVLPTHTYETAPKDLEVLFVPGKPSFLNIFLCFNPLTHGGGAWSRSPDLNTTFEYMRDTFPRLKYLVTVCTGAYVAARAGLLDGKSATTNKAAYNSLTPLQPNVNWVPHARWVVDGNIWTSSGMRSCLPHRQNDELISSRCLRRHRCYFGIP